MSTFTVLLDLLLQCPILNGEFYRENADLHNL